MEPEQPEVCILRHAHWLGSSRDGRVWALAISSNDALEEDDSLVAYDDDQAPGEIVVYLLDPPRRYVGPIETILFRVHVATVSGTIDANTIDRIVAEVPFKDPLRVAEYFPMAPKEWLDLPAGIFVDLDGSEGTGLNQHIVQEYARNTIEEALKIVCAPRECGILVVYTLVL
jgi:hypothetical protein